MNGHKQAAYHYDKLCGLMDRVSRSKNDKNYAVIIAELKHSIESLMKDMRERANDEDSSVSDA
ncbi:MAG TPA: hypothetical protein VKB86_15595 [Pyrinomonadaceae bacterium]|nr:hypothetical protein [Pyrinomonadaceae bacterium]